MQQGTAQWLTVLVAGAAIGFATASFLYGPRVVESTARALIAESETRQHAQIEAVRQTSETAKIDSKTALSTIDEFVAQQRAYQKERKQ